MTPPIPPTPAASAADPFLYGWRDVPVTRPDGQTDYEMVPLTLEDVLHPREDDHIPENTRHERLRRHFQNVFERRLARTATRLSLSDCLLDWDREDVRGHSPDLVVLEREQPWPWRSWGTLHVGREGARALLAVELVSPHTRVNDVVTKVDHYYRVGVDVYAIVDQEEEDGPLTLLVRRWTPAGWAVIYPDSRGRVTIESLGVAVAVVGDRVAIYDAATGQELGDYQAVCDALEAEVKARQAAEKKAHLEEEARQAAERQTLQEAQARHAAEEKARQEEEARQAAEQRAVAAEDRIRLLEEQLRLLRGSPPTS